MLSKHEHGDLTDALRALSSGQIVLLHDSSSRENEIDMIAAAEHVSPEIVGTMREEAGGLVCLALGSEIGQTLGLPYMRDIFRAAEPRYPILGRLNEREAAYGDKSAFSITINHKKTFTGITDNDRALTVREFAELCRKVSNKTLEEADSRREMAESFKAPGHVHLLLEAEGSLEARRGHTEMSVYLCRLAGLVPATLICEMMDGGTHNAFSMKDAASYAKKNSIPMLDAQQVLAYYDDDEADGRDPRVGGC